MPTAPGSGAVGFMFPLLSACTCGVLLLGTLAWLTRRSHPSSHKSQEAKNADDLFAALTRAANKAKKDEDGGDEGGLLGIVRKHRAAGL